jgi:DNA ligase (NAD+)
VAQTPQTQIQNPKTSPTMDHKQYLELISKVNTYRNQIHLFSDDSISEEVLDGLKHQITLYEVKNPTKIDPNSPNYTIAGGISDGFQKHTHKRRMLSLNDIFDKEELVDWEQRWQDHAKREGIISDQSQKYICEPKIDGLAISLQYENGDLIKAITRGDGFVGEDVTSNIMQISNIPKKINDNRSLEVRGEIFITKSDFELLNKQVLEGQKIGKLGKTGIEGQFANSRNVASGTLRQLDSRIVAERSLSFIAYSLFFD